MPTDPWADYATEQSAGGKGISFGGLGDMSQINVKKGGLIVDILPKQESRDFNDKTIVRKTTSGKTIYQLPVKVRTNERDPANPEDDGVRVLYIKGLMFDAVSDALKKAGAETLAIGSVLEIAYIGDRAVGKGKMRAFIARYIPGAPQAAAQAELFGQQAPPPPAGPWGSAPAQQAPPVQQYAAPAAAPQWNAPAAQAPPQQAPAPSLQEQWAAAAPQQPAANPFGAQPVEQAPADPWGTAPVSGGPGQAPPPW